MGFSRLWIIVSAFWFIGWATVYSKDVYAPSIGVKAYVMPDETGKIFELDNYFSQFDEQVQKHHWVVEFPNGVRLLVHNNVPKSAAEARASSFYQEYSKTRDAEVTSHRWAAIKNIGMIGLLPPLALLTLGWIIAWGLAGFRAD